MSPRRRVAASPRRSFAASPRRSFAASPGLPDLAALALWAHHRFAGLAMEGFGERGHIRQRPVDAETSERVRVNLSLQARVLWPHVARPDLRPA